MNDAQRDELAAIESIYPDLVSYESETRVVVRLANPSRFLRLVITLPAGYPESEPPLYELSGPDLSPSQRRHLQNQFNEAYLDNMGEPVLFLWVSLLNEFWEGDGVKGGEEEEQEGEVEEEKREEQEGEETGGIEEGKFSLPEIVSGDSLSDRKSVFQAHLARIQYKEQVPLVMSRLLENGKIARATHNIYAWRVMEERGGRMIRCQDCEDDGETGASAKMLDLLEKMGADGVLVVVTRWYGGVHLGPDRFRIINNMTREIVAACGLENRT